MAADPSRRLLEDRLLWTGCALGWFSPGCMDYIGSATPGLAPQLLEELASCAGHVVSGGHVSATLVQFRRQRGKNISALVRVMKLSPQRGRASLCLDTGLIQFLRVLQRSWVGKKWHLGSSVLLKSQKLGASICPARLDLCRSALWLFLCKVKLIKYFFLSECFHQYCHVSILLLTWFIPAG